MRTDAIACEPQFLDHLAPVWRALPDEVRGTFFVHDQLLPHARARGLQVEPFDAITVRRTQLPDTEEPQGPKALVASYGDTKIGRRRGYGDFAFLEHGIGQSYAGARTTAGIHASYAGGGDRDDTSLFLVPNEHAADRWRRAYPSASVATVGCPKLDTLPRRIPDGLTTIAISFHWPAQYVVPEAGTAWGHFEARLGELAKRFHVIGHAHPKGDWPDRLERRFRDKGIGFVRDFEEVCRRADLYACDNSSTIYEFAATGRPVLVLNAPHYRKDIEHGLRFWEAASVGINVFCSCDLVALAGEALKDDEQARRDREAALDIVYAHRSGAAERAAGVIAQWAAQPALVAA